MFFAYVDESGDAGAKGSKSYALACVLVRAAEWPDTFDQLISFRRFLRSAFGLPVRAEIKANHLLQNGAAFRPLSLSEPSRANIYRMALRLQPKLGLLTFAIVIRKEPVLAGGRDARLVAWEYLLQRLERFSTKNEVGVLIVHDEGEGDLIRKLARKARRAGTAGSAFGTGFLKRPAKLLLDDPVSRDSRQSYFLQLADLNAYAAFRVVYPPPLRRVQIVLATTWNELGDARLKAANALAGCKPEPGLVEYP